MDWLYYAAAAGLIAGTLCSVAIVGKPRDPVPGYAAAIAVVFNALTVWLLIVAGLAR